MHIQSNDISDLLVLHTAPYHQQTLPSSLLISFTCVWKNPVPQLLSFPSNFHRKTHIHILGQWHHCPIWPPVIPLNRNYTPLSIWTPYFLCAKSHIHFRFLRFFLQPSNWRTNTCLLSVGAYSVYPELTFISGVHFLHPQPKNASYRDDKG
jgi:hypothetical protein